MKKRKTICLFAGASQVEGPFIDEAFKVGQWIGQKGFNLIYGGSFVGCMGAIAKGALETGVDVTGVIPEYWKDLLPVRIENLHSIITNDLFDRKRIMIEEADSFLAFPGGIGTIDELFEVLTLNQISQMNKPLTLYNFQSYFEPLIGLLRHCEDSGFISEKTRPPINMVNDLESLRVAHFTTPVVE